MGRFGNSTSSGGVSVQQEAKRAKHTGWRDVIICAVIILAALLFRESRDDRSIGIAMSRDNSRFTVVGMDDTKHTFVFAETEAVALSDDLEAFDRGELISGDETKKYVSGTFRNAAFGTYELHVAAKLHDYIVVQTADGVLVFNYESDETTRGLYDYLCQYIPAD